MTKYNLKQEQQVFEEAMQQIKEKDLITYGHCVRVGQTARKIAEALGKSELECDIIERAATLHDIGKTQIPDSVLKKPDRLTDEEYGIIKSHAEKGVETLKALGLDREEYLQAAGDHHVYESHESKRSYGVTKEHPSELAQIIAVADAYDAISYPRQYSNRFPEKSEVAERMMKGNAYADKQFNQKLLDTFFEKVFDRAERERDQYKRFVQAEERFKMNERIKNKEIFNQAIGLKLEQCDSYLDTKSLMEDLERYDFADLSEQTKRDILDKCIEVEDRESFRYLLEKEFDAEVHDRIVDSAFAYGDSFKNMDLKELGEVNEQLLEGFVLEINGVSFKNEYDDNYKEETFDMKEYEFGHVL